MQLNKRALIKGLSHYKVPKKDIATNVKEYPLLTQLNNTLINITKAYCIRIH